MVWIGCCKLELNYRIFLYAAIINCNQNTISSEDLGKTNFVKFELNILLIRVTKKYKVFDRNKSSGR